MDDEHYDKHKRRELADIFAGLASVGLLMAGNVGLREMPKRAYSIADALLEERRVRHEAENDQAENHT